MLKNLLSGLLRGRPAWTVDEVRQLILAGRYEEARQACDLLHSQTPERHVKRLCLLAEAAFREGKDGEAERLYREAVRLAPGTADGHYGLSLLMCEAGQYEAAVQHAQFAKGDGTADPRYLAQLGLCQLHLKNYSLAEMPLRQAVQGNDADKASWNNLGIVLRAKAEFGEALFCFRKALALDEQFALARQNLEQLEQEVREAGGIWEVAQPAGLPTSSGADMAAPWAAEWRGILESARSGEFEGAAAAADRLLLQWDNDPLLVIEVARLYQSGSDSKTALHLLSTALLRDSESVSVLAALGSTYLKSGMNREAELVLRKAFALDSTHRSVRAQLAQALHQQEKYEAAAELLVAIPEETATLSERKQLAAALVMACDYDRAIDLYSRLQAEGMSELSAAMGGLGMALGNVKRFDEALALLDKVIDAYPAEPNVRAQRSHIHLLRRDFAKGWEDYKYRGLSATKNFRVLPVPQWEGQPLDGSKIVVLAEQGLGDQIMFASCLPDLLAGRPSRVVIEAIDRVAPTLARSFPTCEVVATKQNRDLQWFAEFQNVDYFVPLADLPRFYRPDASAFPGTAYLRPDPDRVAYWRDRLLKLGPRPWIGVSWKGGTPSTRTKLRTMDVRTFAPHIRAGQATWVSLQYGDVTSALQVLAREHATLAHWPESITNLDEFAALISALDAVITVCNTTVHYAGGLGRPTWVLAPEVPEWRYGLNGIDMPWYGSVRVLRQDRFGEWEPVVARAVNETFSFLSDRSVKIVEQSRLED